jgi:hypothetical protein
MGDHMIDEKIVTTLRKKYRLFVEKSNEARMVMAQIQAICEVAELTPEQANEILGVELFTNAKEDRDEQK